MQVLERTKKEVEMRASTMSDFLKMEYLESCIKKTNDPEILRYCYKELSILYERRSMFNEALKYIAKFKEVCILQREKMESESKEIELLIKSGSYERADLEFKEACKTLAEKDKFELKRKIIELYRKEAQNFEKFNKNAGIAKVYEKLINYLSDQEKVEAKKKMLVAYRKLGKVRESIELERQLMRDAPGYKGDLL